MSRSPALRTTHPRLTVVTCVDRLIAVAVVGRPLIFISSVLPGQFASTDYRRRWQAVRVVASRLAAARVPGIGPRAPPLDGRAAGRGRAATLPGPNEADLERACGAIRASTRTGSSDCKQAHHHLVEHQKRSRSPIRSRLTAPVFVDWPRPDAAIVVHGRTDWLSRAVRVRRSRESEGGTQTPPHDGPHACARPGAGRWLASTQASRSATSDRRPTSSTARRSSALIDIGYQAVGLGVKDTADRPDRCGSSTSTRRPTLSLRRASACSISTAASRRALARRRVCGTNPADPGPPRRSASLMCSATWRSTRSTQNNDDRRGPSPRRRSPRRATLPTIEADGVRPERADGLRRRPAKRSALARQFDMFDWVVAGARR